MVAMIADFVAGRAGVSPDDLQAWAADLAELDRRGEFYFSCVQVCFTARKPV
jgi:hypothetical protein